MRSISSALAVSMRMGMCRVSGVALKNFADFQAGHFRQHQIENDQDRRFFARPTQTGRAIRGGDDIESGGAFESANQYFDDVGFVFDDENFFSGAVLTTTNSSRLKQQAFGKPSALGPAFSFKSFW